MEHFEHSDELSGAGRKYISVLNFPHCATFFLLHNVFGSVMSSAFRLRKFVFQV